MIEGLSEQERTDLRTALVFTMKALDDNATSLNKVLADRLEALHDRLLNE
jgi:hypothetical protein